MSCCDRRFLLLGALALGGAAGGCGFRPLYGGGADSGPGRLFRSVRIEREAGEQGFRLHQSLIERLRPPAADAPLVLTTRTRQVRTGLAIEEDDQVTRYNLQLTTRYALRRAGDAPSAAPLAEGEVRSVAAYNALPASQYATLVSEREVLRRAAEETADKIVKRLAVAYDPAWGA